MCDVNKSTQLSDKKTLYEIIGVSKSATHNEIRIAYHKLIKKIHPDKNTKVLHINVEEINNAYGVLKDPMKRSNYDQTLNYRRSKDPDFVDMKKSAIDFFKSHDSNALFTSNLEKNLIKAQKTFEEEMKILNIKTKATEENLNSISDLDYRIRNLEITRNQEEIETLPDHDEPLSHFDIKKFNYEFTSRMVNTQSVIKYDEMMPFNYISQAQLTDVGQIDTEFVTPIDTLTDIQGNPVNDVFSVPSNICDDNEIDFEEFRKQRELETKQLDKISKKPTSRYVGANGHNANM